MSDVDDGDHGLDDRKLLGPADVADMLGVPSSWVYAEARAGRLPTVRVGRYRRFRRRAIEGWIRDHEGRKAD